MANITLKGNPIHTNGKLPNQGSMAVDFNLTAGDLSNKTLSDFAGKKVIMNIFPSVDTGVCAASVRKFNEKAAALENTVVLCISRDLPFAQSRFCGAEGIENVVMLSDYNTGKFAENYGLKIIDGPLVGLLSRCIVILSEKGEVIYTEQVPEITQDPDFEKALQAV